MEMIFQLSLAMGITVVVVAFLAEYVDSTLGMGYGTTLTPLLMLMGFDPLQVVPAVLLSELITGLLAGFTHHSVGNVDFKPKTMNVKKIIDSFREIGVVESFKKGVPSSLRIALLIGACSIIGTVAAVFLAINLPKFYLKLYIGILILTIGIVILATINKNYGFSWKKVTILGLIASFNKGMSGGGYGPVVVGGQMLSGINEKNAVAITSLAEGLTCAVGVIVFLLTKGATDWILAPYLVIGAVFSVPLAVFTVKIIKVKFFRITIGLATLTLGFLTLGKVFF